jgi:hypothetical protein
MMIKTVFRSVTSSLTLFTSQWALAEESVKISYIDSPPVIDGTMDKVWDSSPWMPMDFLILGEKPTPEDFSGAFKLRWDEEYLYLLAKIRDDVLADSYPNPTEHYWDDDSLEIFLDPDASGGDHLHSYNAYAYHIALDGNVVDLGTEEEGRILLNSHLDSEWARSPDAPYDVIWEVRMKLYSDKWGELGEKSRMALTDGHTLGFMLAWCDGDGKGVREHFVGSNVIKPINGSTDLGYKTADVFSKMRLEK